MVSIALVMSVTVTNIYMRKDTSTRVPRCVRRLFLIEDDDDDEGDVVEQVARAVPPPPPPPPPTTMNGKPRPCDVWTVGGRGRDDVETTGGRPRRRAVDVDAARRRPLGRHLAVFPDSPQRRELGAVSDGDVEATEWQQLARIVDRLFFWLFMVSSVGLLTGLYVVLLVVLHVLLVVHGLQRWTADWALRCSSGCSWSPASDC